MYGNCTILRSAQTARQTNNCSMTFKNGSITNINELNRNIFYNKNKKNNNHSINLMLRRLKIKMFHTLTIFVISFLSLVINLLNLLRKVILKTLYSSSILLIIIMKKKILNQKNNRPLPLLKNLNRKSCC
jgi:hypothetical protein